MLDVQKVKSPINIMKCHRSISEFLTTSLKLKVPGFLDIRVAATFLDPPGRGEGREAVGEDLGAGRLSRGVPASSLTGHWLWLSHTVTLTPSKGADNEEKF